MPRKTTKHDTTKTDETQKPSGEDFELHGGGGSRGSIDLERNAEAKDEDSSDDDFEAHRRATT
jgi:hypothetical protein